MLSFPTQIESVSVGKIEQVRQISDGRSILRDIKAPLTIRRKGFRMFGKTRHNRIGEIVQTPFRQRAKMPVFLNKLDQ